MADVVANGVRHHVQRLGHGGHPVVFVHGLVMDNLSSFYFTLANPVAETADVVLYDLRGHGMSERPASGYAVANFVADLGAVLDGLGITEPVAQLALIDAHVGVDGWAAQMTATLSLEGDERDAKIADSFQSWLGRHSERKRTRLAKSAEALVEGTSLVADLRASPPLALAGVRCPVLALYGERSDVRSHGEALAKAVPSCTLQLLPGCSHSVLWEATADVRDRVVGFVRGAA